MRKLIKIVADIIILVCVIGLYVLAAKFIYTNFRERKRNEITDGIIDKIDKKIDDIKKEDNSLQTEADVKYNGTHYTVLGKLNIKKINFYQPILKEKTSYAYNVSVVKIKGPDLNEEGNFVIGGHNYMRKVFFMKINKLTKGDVINITDLNGRSINYYVYEYKVTSADDSSYLKDIEDGGKYITLVTCNYGGKERYIVKAKAK